MPEPVRIAMWSGPRNISTAMMRAFENRPDTSVVDEPFYAAYLAATGLDHPMRAEVLAAQPTGWCDVVERLLGPAPEGRPVFYQKHMTHHILPEIDLDWTARCRNAFLIRTPEAVLASYAEKRSEVTLSDLGFLRQRVLFDRECDRLGKAPPVIDARDVLHDPRGMLTALCGALGLAFSDRMLTWPAGTRSSDGVWAPAWYDSVIRSTGFTAWVEKPISLPPNHARIAAEAWPHYERLSRFALEPQR